MPPPLREWQEEVLILKVSGGRVFQWSVGERRELVGVSPFQDEITHHHLMWGFENESQLRTELIILIVIVCRDGSKN